MNFNNKKALIFDMDGTIVDSEIFTEQAVAELMTQHSIQDSDIDLRQFHGITWESITNILIKKYPTLVNVSVSDFLQESFHNAFMGESMAYIPGAVEFFKLASKHFQTAIATSSNRESVEFLVEKMHVQSQINLILSAEDYEHSKPNPECYLKAAKKLNLKPKDCVVFEDSIPGLQSGRSAGMTTVAICMNALDMQVVQANSDYQIQDYTEIAKDIFDS